MFSISCTICASFVNEMLEELLQIEGLLLFYPNAKRFLDDEKTHTPFGKLINNLAFKIIDFETHYTKEIMVLRNSGGLPECIYTTHYINGNNLANPNILNYIITNDIRNQIELFRNYQNGSVLMRGCPSYANQLSIIPHHNQNISDQLFLRATKQYKEFIEWRFENGHMPLSVFHWFDYRKSELEVEGASCSYNIRKRLELIRCTEILEGDEISYDEAYSVFGKNILNAI